MKIIGLIVDEKGKFRLPKTFGFFPLPHVKFVDNPEIILTKKEAKEKGLVIPKNSKKIKVFYRQDGKYLSVRRVAYQKVSGESIHISIEED
ncbi:MAG: hypothetical protein Q8P79_01850 [Nanoarchaeota archaeon]|nr:hypothetical protein [Nanoarchaeota archaeon]